MKSHHEDLLYLASGDYLAVVRDFALGKGISTSTLLEGAEVQLEDLLNPPKLVPNLLFNRVGANLYNALDGDVSAAAEFGLKMTAATHGSLGLAVRCSENMRAAYDVLSEFYNTRVNFQDIHYEHQGEFLEVTLVAKQADLVHEYEIQNFYDFATLVSIAINTYQAIRKSGLVGKIRLCINYPQPDDFPFSELDFVDLLFDSKELKLQFPHDWLDQPLNIADPDMAKIALEKCASELEELTPKVLVERVRRLIAKQADMPNLNDVAAAFFMSPATFKRKLKMEGATYQSLKDEARCQHAERLILDGKESLEDIAYTLGFNNASNFSKSFKNWTGQTPASYRQTHFKSST